MEKDPWGPVDFVVRVVNRRSRLLGSGVLVDERRVLTCRHVVCPKDEGQPESGIAVSLNRADDDRRPARTVKPHANPKVDLALIELTDAVADVALPLLLKPTPERGWEFLAQHLWRVAGFSPSDGRQDLAWVGPLRSPQCKVTQGGAVGVSLEFFGGFPCANSGGGVLLPAFEGDRPAWVLLAVPMQGGEGFPTSMAGTAYWFEDWLRQEGVPAHRWVAWDAPGLQVNSPIVSPAAGDRGEEQATAPSSATVPSPSDVSAFISMLSIWHPADFKQLCECFPAALPYIAQGSGLKSMAVDLVSWARRNKKLDELVVEARRIVPWPDLR